MKCEVCREILSARLDGEDRPGEAAAADAHVNTCDACAQWWEEAATVTRLARLSAVPAPMPASPRLAPERLAAAAPSPGPHRLAVVLRWTLGLLGLAQFLLGLAQVSLPAGASHEHGGGLSPDHLWHESAAWNIAVGAGFGWIALRRTPPHALLPLLTAFVAMLVLLSANDVMVGTVDGERLVSHAFVAAGYLVLVALSRPRFDFGDPPALRRPRPDTPVLGDDERRPEAEPATRGHRPPLRLVTRATPATTVLRPPIRRVDRARPIPAARWDQPWSAPAAPWDQAWSAPAARWDRAA